MEKSLDRLFQNLKKLTELHQQLLEIVCIERENLVQADLVAIQTITEAKQALAEKIHLAESERVKATSELAIDWKTPLRELSLPKLIVILQDRDPKFADRLKAIFEALILLVQRVVDQNQENRSLVERSLEHINEMKKNVLGEAGAKSSTYSSHGQRVSGSSPHRLISQEA